LKSNLIKRAAFALAALLALTIGMLLLVLLGSALFGWNWARGPIEEAVQTRTGRALTIAGDLHIKLGWPSLHVQAQGVSFANPPWAAQPQMLVLRSANLAIDLPALLRRRWVVSTVHLTQPVVMLEMAADGRKTWLLDTQQTDEDARMWVQRVTLDQGQLGFDDAAANTHLRVMLQTQATPETRAGANGDSLDFTAGGLYKGLPVQATGSGGALLALRDESTPYPLKLDAIFGPTGVRAEGHITDLLRLGALDMQVALRGDSLADLFPLLGVGLPQTRPYVMAGRLQRGPKLWRYDRFAGRVGRSDLTGSLQVEIGGARPFLRGEVLSQVLDFKDLGPAVGVKEVPLAATSRVLPDMPFVTENWSQFDADVTLRAARILRPQALPLDQLLVRFQMSGGVLTLNPLDFGAAGGHLEGTIRLDGRLPEIQASAQIRVRQLVLSQLFPTLPAARSSSGQLNGSFDLTGQGRSVGRMLAGANGRLRLRVEPGEVSQLLMEQMGLHLLEIAQLSLTGDRNIALNCAIADFSLRKGTLTADRLVVDTAINTLSGSGQIDLSNETLDLTVVPRTRTTSLVALRSPIHIGGTLGAPQVTLDKTRVLARAAGAVVLGLVNPLLALVPLVETGPGLDSVCGPRP